jgi:hypothetical protein
MYINHSKIHTNAYTKNKKKTHFEISEIFGHLNYLL